MMWCRGKRSLLGYRIGSTRYSSRPYLMAKLLHDSFDMYFFHLKIIISASMCDLLLSEPVTKRMIKLVIYKVINSAFSASPSVRLSVHPLLLPIDLWNLCIVAQSYPHAPIDQPTCWRTLIAFSRSFGLLQQASLVWALLPLLNYQ